MGFLRNLIGVNVVRVKKGEVIIFKSGDLVLGIIRIFVCFFCSILIRYSYYYCLIKF